MNEHALRGFMDELQKLAFKLKLPKIPKAPKMPKPAKMKVPKPPKALTTPSAQKPAMATQGIKP